LNYANFEIQKLADLLAIPSEVVITTHYNPDGDAIGSSLALYHLLNRLNHRVSLIVPNDIPAFLKWIPGSQEMQIYKERPEACDDLIRNAKVIFSIDYNAFSRVKLFENQLINASAQKILIDHHPFPDSVYDITFSETSVSSTSEMIFRLVDSINLNNKIDADIASCLLVGIMTDTGSFSYSCKNPEIFTVTAELIRKGAEVEKIHRLVYDTYSEDRMRLLGFCLSNRMKLLQEYSTAYIWLSMIDLQNFNYHPGDTEGVVNYPLSIENITMSALFVENDDRIRVSLRSKNEFAVNEIARKHFTGGGHTNAAGADSFKSLEETMIFFESLLPVYKQELSANRESKF
jgi:bifunctional oligoribonuclease and PAP phosphatase NrnA